MGWSPWQDGYDNTFSVVPAADVGNTAFVHNESMVTTPVADITAAVIQILAGFGTWTDSGVIGGFSFAIGGANNPTSMTMDVAYGYEGITLLGSVAETELPTQFPDGIPDNATSIPPDQVNDATLADFIQFESKSNTFLGWQDFSTFSAMEITTNDGGNPAFGPGGTGPYSFTPPSDTPMVIAVTDPAVPVGPQSGVSADGWPQFPGPRLLPVSMEILTGYTTDTRSTDRPGAPYTEQPIGIDGEILDVRAVDIPLSGEARKDLTLYVLPGYFTGTAVPFSGDFGANDFGFTFNGVAVGGATTTSGPARSFFATSGGYPASMHSPRWRYWTDDAVYIFGGHWQRIPGTPDVMVKKTDGTWIPIVDGLAPPLL